MAQPIEYQLFDVVSEALCQFFARESETGQIGVCMDEYDLY
jgi:hypothetical protein